MDQVKIGKFIAQLRKEVGWTQETLGEKVGVTNKTISRWETGNYMPDIEMIQIISKTFDVSINELLAGQRLSDQEYRQRADENIVSMSKESAFSREEKMLYLKRKWRKDHRTLLVMLCLIILVLLILCVYFRKTEFIPVVVIAGVILYIGQNNRMMISIEKDLYDRY